MKTKEYKKLNKQIKKLKKDFKALDEFQEIEACDVDDSMRVICILCELVGDSAIRIKKLEKQVEKLIAKDKENEVSQSVSNTQTKALKNKAAFKKGSKKEFKTSSNKKPKEQVQLKLMDKGENNEPKC